MLITLTRDLFILASITTLVLVGAGITLHHDGTAERSTIWAVAKLILSVAGCLIVLSRVQHYIGFTLGMLR